MDDCVWNSHDNIGSDKSGDCGIGKTKSNRGEIVDRKKFIK